MSVSYASSKTSASEFADKKLTFGGVLKSESLKFRTLTTNWVMTAVIAVVMLGLSALGGFLVNQLHDSYQSAAPETTQTQQADTGTGTEQMPTDMQSEGQMPTDGTADQPTAIPSDIQSQPATSSQDSSDQGFGSELESFNLGDRVYSMGNTGIDLGNILIASVAVVFIAAEYATRSINTTMTAVPKRSMIYFAKLLVVSAYSFVMGFVLSVAGFFIGYMLLDSGIRDQYPLEAGIWINCLGVGLYFMMLSWMGLGFGALMRNNAGGIVLVVLCLFILTIVFGLFTIGFDWAEKAMEYLPNVLGREMLAYTVEDGAKFNNVEAGGLLAIWCVVPAVLGYLRIRFTDPK